MASANTAPRPDLSDNFFENWGFDPRSQSYYQKNIPRTANNAPIATSSPATGGLDFNRLNAIFGGLGDSFGGSSSSSSPFTSSRVTNPMGAMGPAPSVTAQNTNVPTDRVSNPTVDWGAEDAALNDARSAPMVSRQGISAGQEAAARDATFARAKDSAAKTAQAAFSSLQGELQARGMGGGGYEAGQVGGVLSREANTLGEVSRMQSEQDLAQAQHVADMEYQGGVTQRGQNISGAMARAGLLEGRNQANATRDVGVQSRNADLGLADAGIAGRNADRSAQVGLANAGFDLSNRRLLGDNADREIAVQNANNANGRADSANAFSQNQSSAELGLRRDQVKEQSVMDRLRLLMSGLRY